MILIGLHYKTIGYALLIVGFFSTGLVGTWWARKLLRQAGRAQPSKPNPNPYSNPNLNPNPNPSPSPNPNPNQTLVDPMCGSGTFAIEAALIATNTAPGTMRAPPVSC